MKIKSSFKMFVGIMFVIIGLFSIFNVWSVLTFDVPWQTWPIAAITIGVLFIFDKKGFAFAAIGMVIILSVFSGGWNCCGQSEKRIFEERFDLADIDVVNLNLEYGVGNIYLVGEDRDDILFRVSTRDFEDPVISAQIDNVTKRIDVSRDSSGVSKKDRWSFYLGEDVVYDLNLEYGVADVSLDLRDLDVRRVNISEGVSNTRIVFGEGPVAVFIDGGVSNVDFEFLRDSGVVIRVDGGLLDRDFEGFEKRGGDYYSEGFVEGGENIVIEFDGGVGNLNSRFY